MNNILIKNILQPTDKNKYSWNIINNRNTLSQFTKLPENITFETIDNYITTILKKIHENLMSSSVLYNYDNMILTQYNNIVFYKNVIIQINGKITVKYNSSIIHHYATEKLWQTTTDNKSIINTIINTTINKSILNNNDCSLIITNQKLIRDPSTNNVILPILSLEQYVIKPKINEKYKDNIYNYNDILSNCNDIKKKEKINNKIYEIYQNKIKKYLLNEYLNYDDFCEKYIDCDKYIVKFFINGGELSDILILTSDSTPIIIIYTTNIITCCEWFVETNTYVINKQMDNCELINSNNNVLINTFNVYLFNLYSKVINYKKFAIIIY